MNAISGKARAASRLAAVQALYQVDMEKTALHLLLKRFVPPPTAISART